MVSRREFLQGTTVGLGIGCALPAQHLLGAETAPPIVRSALEARFPHFTSLPVSYVNVRMQDRFWAPRQVKAHRVSVPWATSYWDRGGGVASLRKQPGNYVAQIQVGDMEAIKFIEAMATVVGLNRDPVIEQLIEAWGRRVIDSQDADGYPVFCYPLARDPAKRWQPKWLSHEDYAIGHYIEAAIAYREATGRELLFESACRAADNMVATFLGKQRPFAPGHAEVEQALMRLYGVTGQAKYLELCEWLIAQRGQHEGRPSFGKYAQDHLPVKQQRTIEGHAVRAAYLFNGVTEYVGATGDGGYREAVLAIWDDLVTNKLYVHGAGGSVRANNEGYSTRPNYLPPSDTYGESCSVFANFQWAHNLFHLTGDARYLDDAEGMLYNAFYASLSLSGDRFFYRNVAETNEPTMRVPWHPVPCCPPNIVKLLCKVGGYFYSTDRRGIFVKHYGASEARIPLPDVATPVKLIQRTAFPWDGHVELEVDVEERQTFELRLRKPAWAKMHRLAVNGRVAHADVRNGWLSLRREWRSGDRVELILSMEVERLAMPERFVDYAGLAALRRGPIVYCLEDQDIERASYSYPYLGEKLDLVAEHRPHLLGGVTVLTGTIQQSSLIDGTSKPVPVTLVPYGVWNNREPSRMRIWLPTHQMLLEGLMPPDPPSGHIDVC